MHKYIYTYIHNYVCTFVCLLQKSCDKNHIAQDRHIFTYCRPKCEKTMLHKIDTFSPVADQYVNKAFCTR